MIKDIQENELLLPDGYNSWRKEIIEMIEQAKLRTSINVNAELLALYWHIGKNIIKKQSEQGWGTQVVIQLSKDLSARFTEDRGYSERNLRSMKRFATEYPDFPILQVPLAKLEGDEIWQVALAKLREKDKDYVSVPLSLVTWYHHISLRIMGTGT